MKKFWNNHKLCPAFWLFVIIVITLVIILFIKLGFGLLDRPFVGGIIAGAITWGAVHSVDKQAEKRWLLDDKTKDKHEDCKQLQELIYSIFCKNGKYDKFVEKYLFSNISYDNNTRGNAIDKLNDNITSVEYYLDKLNHKYILDHDYSDLESFLNELKVSINFSIYDGDKNQANKHLHATICNYLGIKTYQEATIENIKNFSLHLRNKIMKLNYEIDNNINLK